jgi:signal peptidase I
MCKTRHKALNTILFVTFVVVFLLIYMINFQIIMIDGPSMSPTYRNHQLLLLHKTASGIKNDDIIVFQFEDKRCVKRVIAAEGDIVLLKDNHVYVNDVLFQNSSYDGKSKDYVLSEGEYFVIGDNYRNSIDSRDYGLIYSEQIIGIVY